MLADAGAKVTDHTGRVTFNASLPAHGMFCMLAAFIVGGGVFYVSGASLKRRPLGQCAVIAP
ncbi:MULTISPECIES: hypothetical protein [Pseudomonas]|uniref:hypothetical protein n=1 Tax=Pseudomonas TaxID=286 RepID=UPI0006A610BC|nr:MULTISPECIES: hypothetical protein [Pseudomonas]MBK5544318.1 hypothetical protein [Pseudomonas sp. TH04]MCI4605915.1 hypothetical protein [Pseudomonas fluorescens]NNB71362.1 hypothetical protein [Pseudomonas fluorescens]OEC68952.1 hypothetical protein A7D21_31800 [Pseudomonas sp. AP19]PQA99523.1 hypothetical protein B0A76_17645 [Pseudomonas fluorescens]